MPHLSALEMSHDEALYKATVTVTLYFEWFSSGTSGRRKPKWNSHSRFTWKTTVSGGDVVVVVVCCEVENSSEWR